jgi:Asp/Glu/Hydantoin racemase
MPTIGFLHTADVHVATFARLAAEVAGGAESVAVVDADLLAVARVAGPSDGAVRAGIERALIDLHDRGADAIVCTCSTIGGEAEWTGSSLGLDVVRVDRPLAELAVRTGARISVVAALGSTLAPTRDLLDDVATGLGAAPAIELHVVESAWECFESGDLAEYHRRIAGALPQLADRADVIVLAQASMAPAAELVDVAVPVLSSPRVAVTAVVSRLSS